MEKGHPVFKDLRGLNVDKEFFKSFMVCVGPCLIPSSLISIYTDEHFISYSSSFVLEEQLCVET